MKVIRSAMKAKHSVYALAGAASLAVMALGVSGAARAGDVYWSVGLSSPGVRLGVYSPQAVYVQPQAVYVQPQPVYVQPQAVYVQPQPHYVQPPPVYAQPQEAYAGWHRPGHGWHHVSRPCPVQFVQQYPVQYQGPAPVYGYRHGSGYR